MEIKILVMCLLLVENLDTVKCKITIGRNSQERICAYIFSDGNYEEFRQIARFFRACTEGYDKPILKISMMNYHLPLFPNGTFTNLGHLDNFTLEIGNGSQIHLLSPMIPNYPVFDNLTFRFGTFDISDSPNLAGWKWEALSVLGHKHIESFEFNVVRSNLVYLPTSFGKIASGRLTAIRISKCRLRWLGKNVFAPFTNLKTLELRGNLIEAIERSHFPEAAPLLKSLDLGKNRLQHFSTDLFTGLQLQTILLDGNNIKMFDNQAEAIIENKFLSGVYGVLWPCDCNIIPKLEKKLSSIGDEECYDIDEDIKDVKKFNKTCYQKLI